MRKRLFSILMTVAMIFTLSTPMGVVSAATTSLAISDAKWTDGDEITVTFESEVKLTDDAKDLILANEEYGGNYSIFAESVSANGSQVVIKVADFTKKVSQIKFTKGSITDADGNALSSDLTWSVSKGASSITDGSLDVTSLPSAGGTVKATINGKMLPSSGYTYQLYNSVNYKSISGTVKYNTPSQAEVTFEVPANTTESEVTYELQYVKSYWQNTAIGDNKVTVAATGSSGGSDVSMDFWGYTVTPTSLESKGGDVTVDVNFMEDNADGDVHYRLRKKASDGSYTVIKGDESVHLTKKDCTFTVAIPENTEAEDATYQFTLSDTSNFMNKTSKTITVVGASSSGGETEADPTITKMSTQDVAIAGTGGSVTVNIVGTSLKKLSSENFSVTKDNQDAGIETTYIATDDENATLTFTLPANNTASVQKYTVTAHKWASEDSKTVDVRVNVDKTTKTFSIEIDQFAAFKKYEEGSSSIVTQIEIQLNQLESVTLAENWRDLIFFSYDKSTKDLALTEEDEAVVNGNTITITFKNPGSVPGFIVFERGALVAPDGAINDGKNNSAFYLKSGATVASMSYNQLNFDSKGGEVVATVKGKYLKSSSPALAAKVYKNDGKSADSLDVTTKVISDETAEIHVQLPENTTNRVQAYRIMPVVNGINTYSTYISGYDVVAVLPEGENVDDDKSRLASVELNGGNDADDRSDVYDTTLTSAQFTLKCDAIIRGTNLSAKKTAVKVVDENGVEWPVVPVYECGATIRWQRSSSFMADDASKNEQHIEFLAPRCLGTTHTYKMYFAVDGENFDEEAVATFIIRNDGIYQPEDGFTLDELGTLKEVHVKYVDTKGKEIAESKNVKGYGITELYMMGLDAKNIKGYKVTKCNKDTNWFLAPTFNEEKQSYEFEYGQHFMRDLEGDDVIYTYEETTPTVKLSTSTYTYDGKTKNPSVKVTLNGKTVSSKEYTVSYASGRKNVGKYSVKVTMKSEGKESSTAYFKINPKKTALKKVTKGKKSFTVKWSKQSKQVTGYQVQYSTSKKFTSKTKTTSVTNYKKTSKKVSKLSAKKKYYVRVRTYKTVNGVKYYSGWSKTKSVKTK